MNLEHKYLIHAISSQAVEAQEMTGKFCVKKKKDLSDLSREICKINFTGLPAFKKCYIFKTNLN